MMPRSLMHLKNQRQKMGAIPRMGAALALLMLVGCIHPYKTEIQQGNVITQEMIDKLKPGMTKSQVRFVLGTPLIIDPFHPERWDYVHVYKKNAAAPAEVRPFTVIFQGDALARIEGESQAGSSATASDGGANAEQTRAAPASPLRAL